MHACGQPLTRRVNSSARYVCGLMSLSLQVSINEARAAQVSAPSSLPANKEFFLLSAMGRMLRSTQLVSSSMRPSCRNRSRPCQWFSAYRIASAVGLRAGSLAIWVSNQ
jgi:hypothetical protein